MNKFNRQTKQLKKMIAKAEKEVNVEIEKQLDLVNCSMIIALYRFWSYRKDRISKILCTQEEIWNECGADSNMSMIRKCDEECDIELTNCEGVSYKNISWLNSDKDTKPLNDYEWYIFKQNQKKWTKAQILACVCLTMHRAEGWGFKRLSELMNHMEDILEDIDYNQEKVVQIALDECGYDWLGQNNEKEVG